MKGVKAVPRDGLFAFKSRRGCSYSTFLTYIAQALVSHLVERRYEPDMLRNLYWIIWYPIAFWLISTLTTVVALPRVLMRPRRSTWESPDRGLR